MHDKWMNMGYEYEDELKPYIEPKPDLKDPKRIGKTGTVFHLLINQYYFFLFLFCHKHKQNTTTKTCMSCRELNMALIVSYSVELSTIDEASICDADRPPLCPTDR